MLLPVAGLFIFFAWRFVSSQIPLARKAPPHHARKARPRKAIVPAAAVAPAATLSSPPRRGTIAIILDDVGFDHQPLRGAMAIDRSLSFSILPNAQHAAECAEVLHRSGFEVMCHLPMEPVDYPVHDPGANAVMAGMSNEEIARATREAVAAVPHAVGVNNHMGSRATADARVMEAVLRALPPGIFYVDSVTTRRSLGGRLARRLRIPTADRKVFLDDVQSETEVRRQLARLTDAAEAEGIAVGIGHMYPVTVKVLTEEIPALRAKGFRFVRASEAVE